MANLDWTKEYDGTAEPDSGGNYDWTLGGSDRVSCAGGIMTYNSVGLGTSYGYYSQYPSVDFDSGFTLEAKIKIVDCETTGFFLVLMRDSGVPEGQVVLKIFEDRISLNGVECEMNTMNSFHIYRITVSGTPAKVYVDTVLRISTSAMSAASADDIVFGDDRNATGLNVNAQMDYLNYRLGLARAPNRRGNFIGVGHPWIFG